MDDYMKYKRWTDPEFERIANYVYATAAYHQDSRLAISEIKKYLVQCYDMGRRSISPPVKWWQFWRRV